MQCIIDFDRNEFSSLCDAPIRITHIYILFFVSKVYLQSGLDIKQVRDKQVRRFFCATHGVAQRPRNLEKNLVNLITSSVGAWHTRVPAPTLGGTSDGETTRKQEKTKLKERKRWSKRSICSQTARCFAAKTLRPPLLTVSPFVCVSKACKAFVKLVVPLCLSDRLSVALSQT